MFNEEEDEKNLDTVITELNSKYTMKAPKIPVVPDMVLVDEFNDIKDLSHVPVGINKETISTEYFNFKDNCATLIVDNDDSVNRDNFVRSLTKVISKIDNNLLLLDVDNKLTSTYQNTTYVTNGFDEVINKICDSMEYQYKTYVDNNYNKDVLKNTKPTTVIFNEFTKILSRISETVKKRYFDALKNVTELNKFSFIYVDRIDNLKKLEYDEWYKKVIQNNYGIWIGNGVADQTLIKTNIGFKKTNNEISDGFGIIIKNTKTNLVKLVSDGENIKVDDEDDRE
jgi:hypothetical protein